MGMSGQTYTPAPLPLGKSPSTHCPGGWAGIYILANLHFHNYIPHQKFVYILKLH